MKKKKIKLFLQAFTIILTTVTMGCFGSGKVSLTVINCPKDNVTISFSDSITMKDMGTPYVVLAVVTILCNGEPVDSANIKIKWWLNEDPILAHTNKEGKFSINRNNLGTDPSGKTIEVTINGSDGEKNAVLVIPPPQ